MNKGEFIAYIAESNKCTKTEAEQVIDTFVSSVIGAMGEDNDISLMGFGNFYISKVEARPGRNPKTGEVLQIKACNQPKFKSSQKLKDVVNKF